MWRVFLALIVIVLAANAQRRMIDPREYDLYQQVTAERYALKRLVILREWEAAYPISNFRRERLLFFANAYNKIGQAANALQIAGQILKLDPKDINALVMIAKIGPTLEAPSPDQVKAVEDAALNILDQAPELARAATASSQAPAERTTLPANDPETERLDRMIRELRSNKRIKTAADVESEFRAIAEPALVWASGRHPYRRNAQ